MAAKQASIEAKYTKLDKSVALMVENQLKMQETLDQLLMRQAIPQNSYYPNLSQNVPRNFLHSTTHTINPMPLPSLLLVQNKHSLITKPTLTSTHPNGPSQNETTFSSPVPTPDANRDAQSILPKPNPSPATLPPPNPTHKFGSKVKEDTKEVIISDIDWRRWVIFPGFLKFKKKEASSIGGTVETVVGSFWVVVDGTGGGGPGGGGIGGGVPGGCGTGGDHKGSSSENENGILGVLAFKEKEWTIGDLGFLMRMGSSWASSWAAEGFAKYGYLELQMGKKRLAAPFEYDADDDIICDVSKNRKAGRIRVFDGLLKFFSQLGQIDLSSLLWTSWGIFTLKGQVDFYPP